MKKYLVLCLAGVILSTIQSGFAQQLPVDEDFDHILYLTINSDPEGATIYALPEGGKKVGEPIGQTPCQALVGLKWNKRMGFKLWKQMNIWAPEDICYALLDYNKTWDIFISCSAVHPGYKPKILNESILSLPHPGFDWEDKELWPTHLSLQLKMTPDGTDKSKVKSSDNKRKTAHRMNKKNANRKPVIMASKKASDPAMLGTISITSPVKGASVYVDSQPVGKTPVDVKAPAGTYLVTIFKDGYQPFSKKVQVKRSASIALKANMAKYRVSK